jgi:DNA adenine methylase
MKPLLKWCGSKGHLANHIAEHYYAGSYKRLVEPFCGASAVTLHIEPEVALLNDVNPHLINLYKQIQQQLDINLDLFVNDESYYYTLRNQFNTWIEENNYLTKDAALLFYYLNKHCFNGLCRFNNKGEFNVPYGKYKTVKLLQDFISYTNLFSTYCFSCSDFEQLEINDDDFVYVDPPYYNVFTKYAQQDFKWEDQLRLVNWLSQLNCTVIASNSYDDTLVKLYSDAGFIVSDVIAPRSISCNGDRTPVKEMIVYKIKRK